MFNKKFYSGASLAVLAVLFVALTFISNQALRGLRVDLTEGRVYTLSDGTRQVLGKIEEPVDLYFFYSDAATANLPQIRSFAQRVKELLLEIAQASRGKVRLKVIDPQPFSEEEDEATRLGVQAVPAGNGDNIYFGLAGSNAVGEVEALPFFQIDKERFLEYDVIKLVHSLSLAKKPVVGVLSSLPITGDFDMQTRRPTEPIAVVMQARDLLDIRPLDRRLTSIDEDITMIWLVHPKGLSDDTLYALDQFVLRGGRLAVFVDPNAEAEVPENAQDPMASMMSDRSSNLDKLFKSWGVVYDPQKFVADLGFGLQVQTQQGAPPVRHIGILGVTAEGLDREDVVSAQLEQVNVATAGAFSLIADAKTKLEPLITSSADSLLMPVERIKFSPDPSSLLSEFKPGNEPLVIAGRLTGPVSSAFPDRAQQPGHLAEAKEPVNVLLVADTDILADRLWVRTQNFFGQTLLAPFANNGDLITNALDNLTGSNDLISIRGRQTAQRPFTRVEALRKEAETQLRATEERLRQELSETETKLRELQAGKSEEQRMLLSAAQQAEITRFQTEKLRIRKELRQVQRDLDRDIEALGFTVKTLNIALVPILLLCFVLVRGFLRARPTA